MLTTTEVCRLCGLAPNTLKDWVTRGTVTPAELGEPGRTHSHLFTTTQAVGLMVGVAVYKSHQGCVPTFLTAVVGAFGAVSEQWLTAEFADGRTRFATVHRGKPVLTEPRPYDTIDVQTAYARVREAEVK